MVYRVFAQKPQPGQNLVRAENGSIPRCNDLHTTRELEPESLPDRIDPV